MPSLRRSFRQAHKSGAYVYGRVEDVRFGQATVRLGASAAGPRLTQLAVMGDPVSVGQLVIIDYSTAIPKVRSLGAAFQESSTPLATAAPAAEELSYDPAYAYCMYLLGSQQQSVGSAGTTLYFDHAKFDTGGMFDGNKATIATPGFYFFLAHAVVSGFPDETGRLQYDPDQDNLVVIRDSLDDFNRANESCYAEITLVSSVQGEFGWGAGYSVDTLPAKPTFLEAFGYLNAAQGEEISVVVSSPHNLTSLVVNNLYPSLAGHRMNRDGAGSNVEGGQSDYGDDQTNPPVVPSDIDIQGNQGYLHVSDTAGAYARAAANASDALDVELLVDFHFVEATDGAQLRFFLRATREWYAADRPYSGYEVSISSSGSWTLAKVENGVRTLLDNYNRSATTLTCKLRFQAHGDDLKAKVWLATDAEPAWQLAVTDSPSLPDGSLLLGLYRQSGEHTVYIDNLSLSSV